MIDTNGVQTLLQGGGNVVTTDGTKIGSIGQVYLDDHTSQPEWVTTSIQQEQVSEEVRKEHIEVEGDVDEPRR